MIDLFIDAIRDSVITVPNVIFRLFVGTALGAIIGMERQIRKREAGMRTFALISVGATAAMLLSIWIPQTYFNFQNGDPGRIAAQVLSGIGFLGAGAIIQSKGSIQGLTTAASIWVVAIIGMLSGAGMYIPAIILTILVLVVLISFGRFEQKLQLDGVNKLLTIRCNTITPDLDNIRSIMRKHNISVVTVSIDYDYDNKVSVVIFKVRVQPNYLYNTLFKELGALDQIAQIKLIS